MRQLLPERKAMVKMQVSNILYQEMLAKFQSPSTPAPAPFTQGQIQVEMYQPQQHQQYQPQHHHNFQDKNQMQKRPFPVRDMNLQRNIQSLHLGNFSTTISHRWDILIIEQKISVTVRVLK